MPVVTKNKIHYFQKPSPIPAERSSVPRGESYYIKACNGAGKSTIPSYLASTDPDSFVVKVDGRILLTVCPSYNFVMAGKYDSTKSKGVDALQTKEEMIQAIELSEQPEYVGYDLIFEGIIPATILETWVNVLSTEERQRNLLTLFIDTPLEVCLERIKGRNGNKPFDEDLVQTKFKRIMSHRERHKSLFPNVKAGIIQSNGITIEEMVDRFLQRDFLEL